MVPVPRSMLTTSPCLRETLNTHKSSMTRTAATGFCAIVISRASTYLTLFGLQTGSRCPLLMSRSLSVYLVAPRTRCCPVSNKKAQSCVVTSAWPCCTPFTLECLSQWLLACVESRTMTMPGLLREGDRSRHVDILRGWRLHGRGWWLQ